MAHRSFEKWSREPEASDELAALEQALSMGMEDYPPPPQVAYAPPPNSPRQQQQPNPPMSPSPQANGSQPYYYGPPPSPVGQQAQANSQASQYAYLHPQQQVPPMPPMAPPPQNAFQIPLTPPQPPTAPVHPQQAVYPQQQAYPPPQAQQQAYQNHYAPPYYPEAPRPQASVQDVSEQVLRRLMDGKAMENILKSQELRKDNQLLASQLKHLLKEKKILEAKAAYLEQHLGSFKPIMGNIYLKID